MAAYDFREASHAKLQASEAGVKRFQEDKLGLSVHWGLYSIDANKEWFGALNKIKREEYAKLIDRFNPTNFNADKWIEMAISAGCTAFFITTKHHDGFCLFNSEYTDFNVTKSPFGRDVLKEIADACHKRNVSLYLYYSLIDWNHPLSYDSEFNPPKDFNGYCDFMIDQLKELCTNYGSIAGFLFDGWWPDVKAMEDQTETVERYDWPFTLMYDTIHELQPDAMIVNNHHVLPLVGEDYQVWEMDVPGENTTGFNCEVVGDKPTMAWITSHGGWSWQKANDFKTIEELSSLMKKCWYKGSSVFFNIGPMADGNICEEEISQLNEIRKIEKL